MSYFITPSQMTRLYFVWMYNSLLGQLSQSHIEIPQNQFHLNEPISNFEAKQISRSRLV